MLFVVPANFFLHNAISTSEYLFIYLFIYFSQSAKWILWLCARECSFIFYLWV